MKPAAYRQFAELDGRHWWFRGRRTVYAQLLKDTLGSGPLRRVLDVGAGPGGFLSTLATLGETVAFTEIEAGCARLAAEQAPGVRARAEDIPFASGTLDLTTMFDVLEHVERDHRVLEECFRVLRPGGWLALSVPAHPWLFSQNDELAGHVRRYRRGELAERVRRAGFHIRRCTFANVFLFPAIVPVVLAGNAMKRLVPRAVDPDHTNLSWRAPAWFEECLYRIFCSELLFTRRLDVPIGHSLFLIAEKPA